MSKRHRRHSTARKQEIVEAYLSGEALHACPSFGSVHVTRRFPPAGPDGPGSPPSMVLSARYDSRSRIPWARKFAVRCRTCPAMVRSRLRAPCTVQLPVQGRGLIDAAGDPRSSLVAYGPGRAPQFPGSPSAALQRSREPGRLATPRQWRRFRRCPRIVQNEGAHIAKFEAQRHCFTVPCMRFTTCIASRHALLGSGWLAGLCRVGRLPTGLRCKDSVSLARLLSPAFSLPELRQTQGHFGLHHRAGSLARCNRETATIHGPCRRIQVQRRVDRGGRISRPHPDFEQGAGKDSQVLLIR